MKPTSTNVLLQVAKCLELTRGNIWAVRRMLKCFPAKSLKLIPHQIGSMGRTLSCRRMIPSDRIPGRFDFVARRNTLSHQEMNLTSLFFFACLHFQYWTNTLYSTLTSRAIKKQLYRPVRFQYVCLLPYRWQYRYVTTLLPDFARNVFFGGCLVFIWLSLIGLHIFHFCVYLLFLYRFFFLKWSSMEELYFACLSIIVKM